MWTSLANFSDYIWLATRTDFEAKNHKGISMFIVPTDDLWIFYVGNKYLG